jgi:hypothetical protein
MMVSLSTLPPQWLATHRQRFFYLIGLPKADLLNWPMTPKIIGSYLVIVFAAAVAAGALAALAHTELGFSPSLIRRTALLCSGLLVIGLYSDRFGRRK